MLLFSACHSLTFAQETEIYNFELQRNDTSFTLTSCIPIELYETQLYIPSSTRIDRPVAFDPQSPLIVVRHSSWINECFIIDYFDSELDDSEWIDFIKQFTLLEENQINLIKKD